VVSKISIHWSLVIGSILSMYAWQVLLYVGSRSSRSAKCYMMMVSVVYRSSVCKVLVTLRRFHQDM